MRSLRRPIAALLLVWYLPACTSFQPTDVAPQRALNGTSRAIVTVATGGATETVYLDDPWATADSVGGTPCSVHTSSGWRCDPAGRWSAPAEAVVALQTKKTNPGGVIAVVAIGVGLAIVSLVAMSSSPYFNPD